MVKQALFLLFAASLATSGCASSGRKPTRPSLNQPLEKMALTPIVSPAWQKQLRGWVTDINVSRNGEMILIASAPNPEKSGGARQYQLSAWNSRGKMLWAKVMKSPVRTQTICGEATRISVSKYDETLTVFNPAGKELWTAEAMCTPIFVPGTGNLVCYHDEDAEPQIAFDVFDLKGTKTLSFPIASDILDLKMSPDGMNLVFALTRGQLLLVDPWFRSRWQASVRGEIFQTAVSGGTSPRVAAVFQGDSEPRLALLDAEGKIRSEAKLVGQSHQLKFSEDGRRIAIQSLGLPGEHVMMVSVYRITETQELVREWTRAVVWNEDFSPPLTLTPKWVLSPVSMEGGIAFEGLDFSSGKPAWHIEVPQFSAGESIRYYSHALSPETGLLVVARDDGGLQGFNIPK